MLKNKDSRERGQNFKNVPYQCDVRRYHLQGLGDELEGRFLLYGLFVKLKLTTGADFLRMCSINVMEKHSDD